MPKSDQDLRRDILELRDELSDNLQMVRRVIREDRLKMTAYFEKWGDWRYRPITKTDLVTGEPMEWGNPTEIVIEPLVTHLRTTIKTVIDSIRAIETEILPEDNPEGRDVTKSDSETLRARQEMRQAFREKSHVETGVVSGPAPIEDAPVERMPKPPKEDPAIAAIIKATAKPEPQADWRSTTPKALPAKSAAIIVEKPTQEQKPQASQNKTPGAIGLSPEMRAKLGMSPQMPGPPLERAESRMDALRAKYSADDGDEDP